MIIEGGQKRLEDNLLRQLSLYWGEIDDAAIVKTVPEALDRMGYLLSSMSLDNKYIYKGGQEPIFSPNHSVQYSVFLYLLSNSLYNSQLGGADEVYYLNKIMHSVDLFYAIEFPHSFYAEHPLGSVMGRAKYGERFFFYQGCTVGGNIDNEGVLSYPIIGENVCMLSNSSIIGRSVIGKNVIVSAGSRIVNEIIPDNSFVFGQSPNIVIKTKGEPIMLNRLKNITLFDYGK